MKLGMKTVNNVLRVRHRLTKEEHLQDLLNRKAYSVDVLRAQIAQKNEVMEDIKIWLEESNRKDIVPVLYVEICNTLKRYKE